MGFASLQTNTFLDIGFQLQPLFKEQHLKYQHTIRNEAADIQLCEAAFNNPKLGVNIFLFRFQPSLSASQVDNERLANIVSPNMNSYGYCWDGTYEGAKNSTCGNGCAQDGALCTKLIHLNNWKIPEDYPHKF